MLRILLSARRASPRGLEDENGWDYWWRIIGTNAPGLKTAGHVLRGRRLGVPGFWDWRNCVVLETEHERYSFVIIQTDDDPDSVAAEINRRIGR